MTDVAALKQAAGAAIDAASATLFDISTRMHADVELAFEEVKAQAWQCKALRDAGLSVEEGLGSLKTAFRATATSTRPWPEASISICACSAGRPGRATSFPAPGRAIPAT